MMNELGDVGVTFQMGKERAALPEGNVAKGEKLFKARAAQCHTGNKGGNNMQQGLQQYATRVASICSKGCNKVLPRLTKVL